MKHKQSEDGFTLVVVLMVLVVLSVLTTAIIGLAMNNSKMTRGERDDQSTFYIAEAGLNYRLAEIEEKVDDILSSWDTLKAEAAERELPFAYPGGFYQYLTDNIEPLLSACYESDITKCNATETEIFSSAVDGSGEGDFEEAFGQVVRATTIVVADEDHEGNFIIRSKGEIGESSKAKKRMLEMRVAIADPDIGQAVVPTPNPGGGNGSGTGGDSNEYYPNISAPDGTAVFVKGNITMSGGAKIQGNVGTNNSGGQSVSLSGGADISGGIYVPQGSEGNAVKVTEGIKVAKPTGMPEGGIMELPAFPKYPELPVLPNAKAMKDTSEKEVIKDGGLYVDNWIVKNYTLNLEKDVSFSEIKLNENNVLTINVGDQDRIIVVDHLNVTNGHINIIGTGTLTFLVKDKITLASGSTINNNGPVDKLGIYLQKSSDPKKPKKVELAGTNKIFGSLYAEDANVTLTGGGGFQGNIFTGGKNVTISGGGSASSTLILAPNAHVKLNGGGIVKGSIYADSLTADGGTKVIFGEPTIPTGPFAPDPPDNTEKEDPDPNPTTSNSSKVKVVKVVEK